MDYVKEFLQSYDVTITSNLLFAHLLVQFLTRDVNSYSL